MHGQTGAMHMKALITSENAKTNTFGWLQFEKRGIQELQKTGIKSAHGNGCFAVSGEQHGTR